MTSDDNSGPDPSPRLGRVYDQNPSTSRATKRAMEFINSCSDLKVKTALDKSKLATKITKVKTVKQGHIARGQCLIPQILGTLDARPSFSTRGQECQSLGKLSLKTIKFKCSN